MKTYHLHLLTFLILSCKSDKRISEIEFDSLLAGDKVQSVVVYQNETEIQLRSSQNHQKLKLSMDWHNFEQLYGKKLKQNKVVHSRSLNTNNRKFPMRVILLWIPIIIIASYIISFYCLYRILGNTDVPGTDKLPWVITVIFVPIVGSVLYFTLFKKVVESKNYED